MSRGLPFNGEMWYTISREGKGPMTRSSPGPRPRCWDTLANISITHQPAGVSPTGGFLLFEVCSGEALIDKEHKSVWLLIPLEPRPGSDRSWRWEWGDVPACIGL
jgi:hypothetical protein